jgi:hypothetical protein
MNSNGGHRMTKLPAATSRMGADVEGRHVIAAA